MPWLSLPSPLAGEGQGEGETTLRRARRLRTNQTDAEWRLWERLRARRFAGYKFKRQQVLGPYIVDCVCFDCRLIIEEASTWDQRATISATSG